MRAPKRISRIKGIRYSKYTCDSAYAGDPLPRAGKGNAEQRTNQYEKLANIRFDKEDGLFGYEDIIYDSEIDAAGYCRRAEELFELYQRYANRKQIETICVSYLRSLEATKLSINGHLYFVPRQQMEKVDIFEEFIAALGQVNRNNTPLMANSFFHH